jgi:hypothetical protein
MHIAATKRVEQPCNAWLLNMHGMHVAAAKYIDQTCILQPRKAIRADEMTTPTGCNNDHRGLLHEEK